MKGYYKVLSSSMFSLMLLSSGNSGVLAAEQPQTQVNAAAVATENSSVQTGAAQEQIPMLVDQASIPAVIRAMTLDEKVDLIGGAGAAVTGAAGGTFPIPRLGIPKLTFADGPAGLRFGSTANKSTTGFPIPSALSASFNKDLMYQVSSAMGKETLDYGVDVILGPALNIHRDPRGGRNFEYYSEDPYLSGEMAAEFTKGVQDQGVGVSMKHYAANNQETNRQSVNEIISERALREIYLAGFERVVKEANPWTVMSSYNSINGPFSAHNSWLLNDVLRSDWGFNGMVMTDWGGSKQNGVAMLNGGNDLSMPSLNAVGKAAVKAAILDGSLPEEKLDTAIENILNLVVKSPTFKKLSSVDDTKQSVSADLTAANAKLSREAAPEGMVLLKNKNKVLPFTDKVKKVGLVGNSYTMPSCGFGTPASACTTDNAATKMFLMGTGSAYVTPTHTVQLPEGLKNGGYTPVYTNASGTEINENLTIEDAEYMANNSDIGVVVIARGSGEGADGNSSTFEPTTKELELIKKVSNAYHAVNKKVVVVLNVGAPFNTTDWKDYADSILLSWQPGMEAGNALTDVLSGKANPSGKLPATFPVHLEDAPSYANFPSSDGNPNLVKYSEDIYVGYRYYSTFNVQTAYEFGYGLSYTAFDYSDFKLNKDNLSNKIKVSFKVTNSGALAGKEAPQLYVSAPDGKLEKPSIELKAFTKTRELKPEQKETVNFFISPKDIASFDEDTSSWILEKGSYQFHVGSSSKDFRGTLTFKVDKDLVVETVNNNGPEVQLDRLSKYNQ
ncbi:glycoside hydrolase family 3 C-terminal domain-containing protein [Bacillus sp. ISL-7]|uniref:glycoside hydrolase family 3 C-terminal domain-containing protein n=1 Tax=Bacillus sp. ISL-7 TaxID=2819136 RepID=UPI001BE73BAA|nr:glycoside hydrolase family 3 C-terminal domain-containing protein [Bacillus sp. ISL-7]MBT2733399.1 glycoside hydrolase family 3 C-terminal domain-containing protein [Bacillus sp. ISL-7]